MSKVNLRKALEDMLKEIPPVRVETKFCYWGGDIWGGIPIRSKQGEEVVCSSCNARNQIDITGRKSVRHKSHCQIVQIPKILKDFPAKKAIEYLKDLVRNPYIKKISTIDASFYTCKLCQATRSALIDEGESLIKPKHKKWCPYPTAIKTLESLKIDYVAEEFD